MKKTPLYSLIFTLAFAWSTFSTQAAGFLKTLGIFTVCVMSNPVESEQLSFSSDSWKEHYNMQMGSPVNYAPYAWTDKYPEPEPDADSCRKSGEMCQFHRQCCSNNCFMGFCKDGIPGPEGQIQFSQTGISPQLANKFWLS